MEDWTIFELTMNTYFEEQKQKYLLEEVYLTDIQDITEDKESEEEYDEFEELLID